MTRLDIERSSATRVVLAGREVVYFGGCGYLGLAHDAAVLAALRGGLERYGLSSGASRETSGNTRVHEELERELAAVIGCESALLAPEGYTANFALAQALSGSVTTAFVDELAHPSLSDAARAAGLEIRVYTHGDTGALERELTSIGRRAAVFTDSVFPSRGEIAPIDELSRVAAAHGAWLALDDCHGTGVIGARGRGALEHSGVAGAHVAVTTTLSKALGCYGGVVAGSAQLIERARGANAYVGTTPVPPPVAQAALTALALACSDGERLRAMRANAALLRRGFERLGLRVPREDLPVFAFALASPAATLELHRTLLEDGFLVPHVVYPGEPSGGSLRAVVNAAHTSSDIAALLAALERISRALR